MMFDMTVTPHIDYDAFDVKMNKVAQQALADVSRDVAEDMVVNTPIRTGTNQELITLQVGDNEAVGVKSGITGETVGLEDLEAAVTTQSGYGLYIEMGHHTKSGSWVPSHPYAQPALETYFTETNMANHIEAGLDGIS